MVRSPSPTRSGPNQLLVLPSPEFERLNPHLEAISLEAGQFMVPARTPLPYVYFPLGGVVSLLVTMADGSAVEVALVGREGMLGVSVLLEADPAPYDMVCQVAGEALRMPVTPFIHLAKELPGFRRRLLRYTLGLLNEITRTAACNRLHSVQQRLARWLLLCRDRVGVDSFPMTQESLASMLGARRPFVSQTANSLKRAELIQYQRGTIRILDPAGLQAVACEDYWETDQEWARLFGITALEE